MSVEIHVVSHTHWDREWYHLAGRFRQKLVALIDELIEDPPDAPASFLLDGQAIVIEDYLAIRPERSAELSLLLREGRLEAGPWYVLADELIPSGEALVRNLLAGRRALGAMRASAPPVLYCPDSFGHPAALPELAAGFGIPLLIVWRGFGGISFPAADTVVWRAPSGARAIVYALPAAGYETGASLPPGAEAARSRWNSLRSSVTGRNATGVALLTNGADHHSRQPSLREAVAALSEVAKPDSLLASSLGAFAAAVEEAAGSVDLPGISGELRDSYGFTWTLQGTLATRAAQKRRNAACERLLLRDVEPWNALARFTRRRCDRALERAAWKELLRCHPHDTLCGCSIDGVARAMDARLDEVEAQGSGLRAEALHRLVDHDAASARDDTAAWRGIVLVRNRAPRDRHGFALLSLDRKIADIGVGPGSGGSDAPRLEPPAAGIPGILTQSLGASVTHERTESPIHYPDDDLVHRTLVAAWLPPVPAYGLIAFDLHESDREMPPPEPPPEPVSAGARRIGNGLLEIEWDSAALRVTILREGRTIDRFIGFEDAADFGDSYTPSIRGNAPVAQLVSVEVRHPGPLLGEIASRWRFEDAADIEIEAFIGIRAGSPLVHVRVEGENRRNDHRLRLRMATGCRADSVWADAAFGPVHRVPLPLRAEGSPKEGIPRETPQPTAPLHRYVSLFDGERGATVHSDGLAEYEHKPDGEIAVTLIRAIGELSRSDLPERPGHAGWPAPVPAAQSIGRFEAEFALQLHGGERSPTVVAGIERASDDFLLPLTGETLRSALALPGSVGGFHLEGEGLAFGAAKVAESGDHVVLRCVNLLEAAVDGAWHLPRAPGELRRARLDETPSEVIDAQGSVVRFCAGPREVVTILVR
jgi:alpha-mannosidase